MFAPSSMRLIRYFVASYPWSTTLMVVLLVLAGLAEGVGVVALLPLLGIATGGTTLDATGLSGAVADLFAAAGITPTVAGLLGLIVLVISLKGILTWIAMREVGYSISAVATDLRLKLLRALLDARWSYFVTVPSGHFINAFGSEVVRSAGAYRWGILLFAALFQTLIYTVISLLISWQVTLFAFASGAVILYALSALVRVSRRTGEQETELMKSLTHRLTDTLQGIKAIKAMGQERRVLPLLERETQDLNRVQRQDIIAAQTINAFHEPLAVIMLALGLYLSLTYVDQPFSELLVMVFLFYRLLNYLNRAQGLYQQISGCESAFYSLLERIEQAENEGERLAGGRTPLPLERGIRVENVSFAYQHKAVLSGASLDIPAGAFVALAGPSGAGKTTLADLIVGLQKPDSGSITVDGAPLASLDPGAWRRSIGYVPQDILLFHASVYQNVTLGDEGVSREAVIEALRAAEAFSFVSELPQGIDTVVGERGAKLSGGQRQRIAIARALVHRPTLLVLDEVTTSLDPETEQEVCATLRKLKGQVTTVAISHQKAMTEAADIVYELRHGAVSRRQDSVPATVDTP